ncbi:MAG: hypothetical protein Q9215_007193 [Flavoplaca cf. flavocitrina]
MPVGESTREIFLQERITVVVDPSGIGWYTISQHYFALFHIPAILYKLLVHPDELHTMTDQMLRLGLLRRFFYRIHIVRANIRVRFVQQISLCEIVECLHHPPICTAKQIQQFIEVISNLIDIFRVPEQWPLDLAILGEINDMLQAFRDQVLHPSNCLGFNQFTTCSSEPTLKSFGGCSYGSTENRHG